MSAIATRSYALIKHIMRDIIRDYPCLFMVSNYFLISSTLRNTHFGVTFCFFFSFCRLLFWTMGIQDSMIVMDFLKFTLIFTEIEVMGTMKTRFYALFQ